MQCHSEVTVCRECIEWLRGKAGIVDTTPILPVSDLAASVAFYERAGFAARTWQDGGYAFVDAEGESVFDLDEGEHHVPSAAGSFLVVPEVDVWHQGVTGAGIDTDPPADMPWGMREFRFTDPDGNYIRIGQPI